MDESKVKINIKTPSGNIKRTLSSHRNIDELQRDINIFLKEVEEAVEAGKQINITCSKCCNKFSFKNCFKTKVKTGDNKLSIV